MSSFGKDVFFSLKHQFSKKKIPFRKSVYWSRKSKPSHYATHTSLLPLYPLIKSPKAYVFSKFSDFFLAFFFFFHKHRIQVDIAFFFSLGKKQSLCFSGIIKNYQSNKNPTLHQRLVVGPKKGEVYVKRLFARRRCLLARRHRWLMRIKAHGL